MIGILINKSLYKRIVPDYTSYLAQIVQNALIVDINTRQ